ncbi:DUF4232 domain-containing protein [Streptomyces sp. NPDC059740]|uniref:DUF4232 domain-containing protein n=1 Tax=Streptomyces sp. NPDC059740 TaxID=3346926 RepID=UPI0036471C25
MRVQTTRFPALALVAVVAGLTLTACDGDGGSDNASASGGASASAGASADSSPAASDAQGDTSGSGTSGSGGAGATSGSGTTSGGQCQTSQLAFSTSHGMGEGELLVNLKNTGSAACSLHGFPGVDLKGKDGTISADRSKFGAPVVTVKPGEETRFTLHYPPNNSGGSGVTFTSLVVTPPGETHSTTLSAGINVPAQENSPAVTVDPVGVGK